MREVHFPNLLFKINLSELVVGFYRKNLLFENRGDQFHLQINKVEHFVTVSRLYNQVVFVGYRVNLDDVSFGKTAEISNKLQRTFLHLYNLIKNKINKIKTLFEKVSINSKRY